MAITPMNKAKAMRGSLIDAVDKINEIITAVNTIDVSAIQQIHALQHVKLQIRHNSLILTILR